MKKLQTTLDKITTLISAILCAAMMVILFANVVLRLIPGIGGFKWYMESSQYLNVWSMLIACIGINAMGTNLRVEVVDSILGKTPLGKKIVVIIRDVFIILFYVMVTYGGYQLCTRAKQAVSTMPQFTMGQVYTIFPIAGVLCILSALYSGVTGKPSPVTRLVSFVTTPVQRLASGVTGALGKGFGYFTEFDDLKAENEELKKQIRDMEQTVRDAELAIEENNQLRAAAGQPERTRELTTINAEVIARNPGDWAMTLSLDKGSSHGVEVGDLVTTVDGMVGYVSEVYSNTCEVTTVIDVEMQCGALITRTRETAIAEGNYDLMAEGNLRLSYLTEDSSVVIGDTVETSGRGGLFPKGVMIGTVESVLPEENGISYYAVIKPFANVDTVSSVSIVTDFTDTTE